jgi:ArsR family transcriptional regulator
MRDLIKTFKALSDETRLRIINILLERECCVCEVMQALNISQTRASRNLNILFDAGFLKVKRNGLWVLYSIDREGIHDFQILTEMVSKGLKSNPVSKKDKGRLANTLRVGIGCSIIQSPN